MVKVRKDWPKRHLLDLKGGLHIQHSNVEASERELAKQLDNPTKESLGSYIVDLEMISSACGVQGVVAMFDGQEEKGWELIRRSLQSALGSLKVAAAIGFPNTSYGDTNRAALLFATAIALQSRPVASWLAGLMTESYAAGGPLVDWQVSPFEPLMVHLAGDVEGGKRVKVERAETLPDFYDELLAAEDAEASQRALEPLVVERVRLVSPAYNDYPPFEWSPFDLFPVDLLAVLMIHHSGIPQFDFGALESPLCDPPLPFPFEPDPLVERVLERVAEKHQVAEVSW